MLPSSELLPQQIGLGGREGSGRAVCEGLTIPARQHSFPAAFHCKQLLAAACSLLFSYLLSNHFAADGGFPG